MDIHNTFSHVLFSSAPEGFKKSQIPAAAALLNCSLLKSTNMCLDWFPLLREITASSYRSKQDK